jgi:hypothetical protein
MQLFVIILIKNKVSNNIIQVFAATIIPCAQGELIVLHNEDIIQLGGDPASESNKVEVVVALPGYKFSI